MKEKLLAAAVLRTETIKIEGNDVIVREVGIMEFADYGVKVKTDKRGATALLIASCVVDEKGEPVFTQEEALEVAKSMRVALPIVDAVMRLSGLREEVEKNADAS